MRRRSALPWWIMCKGKELVGGRNRRCKIGGVGSEEPGNFDDPFRKERQGKREAEGHAAGFASFFSLARLPTIPMDSFRWTGSLCQGNE